MTTPLTHNNPMPSFEDSLNKVENIIKYLHFGLLNVYLA